MQWRVFHDEGNDEVRGAYHWLMSLNDVDREIVVGRITALRSLAANGEIDEDDEESLKPIRRDPELYELRWDELGILVRQYHAEPGSLPTHLVNLHWHVKYIAPSDDNLTNNLQDEQISWAVFRYHAGARTEWVP